MNLSSTSLPSSVQLLLIDEDPVFRLGLKVWLDQYSDLAVVAEAEDGETALQILDHQFARPLNVDADVPLLINLVVLDLGLGRLNAEQIQGLNLCSILKSRYPGLPVLAVGSAVEPVILAAAQQTGVEGYCPKTADASDLVRAMRQVAEGQPLWLQNQVGQNQFRQAPAGGPVAAPLAPRTPAPLSTLRRNLRRSGIRQIDAVLADVTAELQNLDQSLLNRAVLAGRQRELKAARWLVNQLLSTPSLEEEPMQQPIETPAPPAEDVLPRPVLTVQPSEMALTVAGMPEIQSVVLDAVLAKLQTGITNQTEITLETDILREDKKRELFYLVLRKFEEVLSELRHSQVEADQLSTKQDTLLLDLWQAVLVEFWGRYYTVRLDAIEVEVVPTLLQDAALVQTAILDTIPGVTELLRHLLFQTPLAVDGVLYRAGNPAALGRAELLLENLMVQVANAVVQPLLNHFANVESIKQLFYDRRLLSSREIERFRNNLSWQYRFKQLFREPQNIFESQYRLFTFTGRGIKQTVIYAPRTAELAQLTGLPYVVTLALETRDAVAPRLRSVVAFVGNSLVYVLTEVIGRGIGLIGRGVLKGLGNVWQDSTKYGRDRQQR